MIKGRGRVPGIGAAKICTVLGGVDVNRPSLTRVPHHRATHPALPPRRQDDASMTNTQAPGGRALPAQITGSRGRLPLRARRT